MSSAFEPSVAHSEMKAALDAEGARERAVAIAVSTRDSTDVLQTWRWSAAHFLRPNDVISIIHVVPTAMEGAGIRIQQVLLRFVSKVQTVLPAFLLPCYRGAALLSSWQCAEKQSSQFSLQSLCCCCARYRHQLDHGAHRRIRDRSKEMRVAAERDARWREGTMPAMQDCHCTLFFYSMHAVGLTLRKPGVVSLPLCRPFPAAPAPAISR